ncbi:hypothetical protein N4P33_17730 [Streptomyces sp. 15-116A]|uniref:hypothetical protein n=1 Tax=Streptomyces sp. 15-116A TaxID=2259035 RepID=UPI0021B19CFA|nr:hypothetical protein [Streptomyces sp. 15-116A]MCT7353984.1 hypothetical protein [Streptomyces sp. 15-116A]
MIRSLGRRERLVAAHGGPEGGADQDDADEAALLAERPAYDDVANSRGLAASWWARMMTATELDLTCDLVPD